MTDDIWQQMRDGIESEAADFRAIKQRILETVPRTGDTDAARRLREMAETCGAHLAYLEVKQGELEWAEQEDERRLQTTRKGGNDE